jgi:hypothetical protein
VTTSTPGTTGTFQFDPASGVWRWSEEVFALYGFAPGDVVPTTELVLSHQHPEDRAEVARFLRAVVEDGRARAVWHRLVNSSAGTRQILTICSGELDDNGTVRGVHGFKVDVTEVQRLTTAREVAVAMELMAQSRPVIEQAKGALMTIYGLDDEDAFLLLRRYSQQANVKLRDVARNITEALPDGDLPVGSRATWDELADELRDSRVQEQPGA